MLQAVFLRVVNMSVSASYVILAVLVMRPILRRAPRWAVCALWALAAVRLICPITLESALSLLPSGGLVNETAILAPAEADSAPIIQTGISFLDQRANAAIESMAAPAPSVPAGPSEPAAAASEAGRAPILDAVQLLSWLWLAGVGAMVLYGAVGYILLRRRLRTAVHLRDELWQSEAVDAPFVLGLIRPRIYLPFAMDSPVFADIIAHERAHIRRRDPLTKALAWALLSVYWFHPLCWVAWSLLGQDMELACDERVIRTLDENERKRYARALLAWGADRHALDACPVAFGEVGLKERILKVIRYKKPALWAMILALVLIAGAGACLLTSPAAEADALPAGSPLMDAPPAAEPADAAPDSLDRDAVPRPAPILTVRPRDITAQEAEAIVTAIFGDAPVYAGADSDASEQELCDWTFRPQDGDSGDMAILAHSSLDGGDYVIEVLDPNGLDAPGAPCLMIYRLDDGPVPAHTAPPTQGEVDQMCAQAAQWLEKMGLTGYAVVAAETAGDVTYVTAQPAYDGVVQLPFDWWHDPPADQTLWFSFSGGELDACVYSAPLEVSASQEQETLLAPGDALAAAGLEDGLAELDWRFCYTRVPDADGSGDHHLVPSYRYGAVNMSASDTGILIVSAVDGSLMADTRPEGWAGPAPVPMAEPTPTLAVQEIEVRWGVTGAYDYAQLGAFDMPAGSAIPLSVIWYPATISAVPVWTVDDADLVSLAPAENGLTCQCTMTGQSGQSTVLHVTVNDMTADITVNIS